MTRATIDRFEEELAVVIVDGVEQHVPRATLSSDAREGDVVDLETGEVDADATRTLRAEVAGARARLKRSTLPDGEL